MHNCARSAARRAALVAQPSLTCTSNTRAKDSLLSLPAVTRVAALLWRTPAAARTMVAAASAADAVAAQAVTLERFRRLIPQLGAGSYKGAHGKVAVVGGCLEFTGAPFFAAMSALKVGADMAYVICTPSAATAIKCYSPELMVLPYLPEHPGGSSAEDQPVDMAAVAAAVSRITPWLSRATAVVVGPGLGDDPAVCAAAACLVAEVRRLGLPLVVDGSALTHIVAKQPEVVAGYVPCVLTPNVAELGRIAAAVGLQLPGRMSDAWLAHAPRVAEAFHGPVVLAKGEVDLVCVPSSSIPSTPAPSSAAAPAPSSSPATSGTSTAAAAEGAAQEPRPLLQCSDPGSLRRCGGQGDVLAGTAAAFLCWAAKHQAASAARAAATPTTSTAPGTAAAPDLQPPPHGVPVQPQQQEEQQQQQQQQQGGPMPGGSSSLGSGTVALCAYMACKVMRGAARRAYATHERSMLAGDIIPHLHSTLKELS